ncbi:putative Mn2+ efflux pump MntP [Desulfobotulus alkaliphilus]|uniref:Putative Mn2+ efflux pump MntP n=2 Tax=Desulfobotulus alkaliphilus TaxID=622671 RepID=A0A562S362_9BACT|nr:putative Mn2+ efflux pump MntP [Desulfobotulus alkaliphilus]
MCPVQIFLISMILSLDAFVLSLAQGLRTEGLSWKHLLRVGVFLGVFQGGMLILGWMGGLLAGMWLSGWYPWLVFGILLFIGCSRIRCGLRRRGNPPRRVVCCRMSLLMLALILSLDAFAVGLGLGLGSAVIPVLTGFVILATMGMVVTGMSLGLFMGDIPWMRNLSECAGGVFILALAFRSMPVLPFFLI